MAAKKKVLIAGAGIGGLTLGHALLQRGFEVEIFERAPALLPLGAGITIQSNAVLALRTLGLDAAIAARSARIDRAEIVSPTGAILSRLPLDAVAARLGAPMLAIHRGVLQQLLAAGLEPHLRLGSEAHGIREEAGGVALRFADGSEARGDLLVGADGLHSAIRRHVAGEEAPRYAGYTAWRGVARMDTEPGRSTEAWGAGERFGVVPIGEGLVYWFGVADAPAGVHRSPTGEKEELLRRFGSWHEPCGRLIEATPAEVILRTDIFDRTPIAKWSRGCVTLLGDAAHPMTPNLGQGGCQAIEDAVVLAGCLAGARDLAEGLAAYEARRVARANRFVAESRRLGQVAQWRHPIARIARTALLRATPAAQMERRLRATLAFEP